MGTTVWFSLQIGVLTCRLGQLLLEEGSQFYHEPRRNHLQLKQGHLLILPHLFQVSTPESARL